MNVADARAALARLPSAVELVDLQRLAPLAMEIEALLNYPAYDCFYLAPAVQQGRPLLTADGRLGVVVDASSLPVPVIRLDQLRN